MKWTLLTLFVAQFVLATPRPSESLFEWRPSSLNFWPQTSILFPSADFFSTLGAVTKNLQVLNQNNNVINAINTQPNPWNTYPGLMFNPYIYSYISSAKMLPYSFPEYPVADTRIRQIKTKISPFRKFLEPPTLHPNTHIQQTVSKSDKFSDSDTLENDSRLISAVQQVNPTFILESLNPVPGTQFFHFTPQEIVPQKIELEVKKQMNNKISRQSESAIKVEAIGSTAIGKNVPVIPFASYFLPYSTGRINEGKKVASLILQPKSKAIVGNGGTAISAPISRAVLKKGVPTNVFFNPESVAIAGAGGKAHAQADLILDLMER